MILSSPLVKAQQSDATHRATLFPRVIEEIFQPNYKQFAETSEQLLFSAQSSCEERSTQGLSQLKNDYRSLVSAFARIELYRLGPMQEELRQNRLFYWPDKRQVGERQLRRLLLDPESNDLTESELVEKSVALQGLPAIERLLFSKNTAQRFIDTSSPDCHVATVIATNINSIAEAMLNGWNDESRFVQSMRAPSSDSDLYRNDQEVLQGLVTQIVAGIDVVIDYKIVPLLGTGANMRKAPLWLSEQTIPMIKGNLDGIRMLLLDSGLAAETNLDDELKFEFRSASTMLERLSSLPGLAEDQGQLTEEAYSVFKALSAVLSGIDVTVNDRFLKALGISAGFNSGDGD